MDNHEVKPENKMVLSGMERGKRTLARKCGTAS